MTEDLTSKVWKSSPNAKAGITASEKNINIVAGKNNIAVSEQGLTLSGPLSLGTDAFNLRRGGLFVGISDFSDMIPSTIITPIPKNIPIPPIQGLIGIAKDVAFFKSILS